ncbi:uncharacterized protein STEHIDRAFT_163910 [Stereum hirsutum FP-91666 SS1]|uniref:Uncharacterized protein n=1 Tax=Stereum hirsutum (strain FP-91666) TaxID=721885 RepID=R7RWS9_STEHR|nr:uncharacterized protein STEHIDRAFT_163910 [Stereum hirsutum FP-91666 SS1]EIM79253.1 hypothetical protein STEHIDRAFT_163910 [Stereum hirsutum FP-91666 SS1]
MDGLQETFRWAALECAAQAPVAAYAFGRQHNFGDLVVSAAQLSLKTSIIEIPHSPELKRISGSELQELIAYHRRCQAEASRQYGTVPGHRFVRDPTGTRDTNFCPKNYSTFLKAAESLAKKVDELTNEIAKEMFMEGSVAGV